VYLSPAVYKVHVVVTYCLYLEFLKNPEPCMFSTFHGALEIKEFMEYAFKTGVVVQYNQPTSGLSVVVIKF